jgi:hypothetical protein
MRSIMNALSPEQRIEGLRRLEARSGQHLTALILNAIDTLIVFGDQNFSNTILEKIVEAGKHPAKIQRALQLYAMMFRLMSICEPRGNIIGPACYLSFVNFETLSRKEAFELKNGFGFRLILTTSDSANNGKDFCALDLLSDEEKELYERVKPFFAERKKPTLKILAARLLRNSEEKFFSDRNILRYIEALNDYEFAEPDHRPDYLISSVNSFGVHNKSASESARYVIAQAVVQVVPVINEKIIPLLSQTPQLLAQTLPRIGESIVLMRETLPILGQTLPRIAQSVAQIPVVLPQIQLAVADLYRSLPQTLSLFANLDLKVRQN